MPLPVPVAPAVMLIQGESTVAERSHEVALAVMVMEPVPPAAAKLALVGERVSEHCVA